MTDGPPDIVALNHNDYQAKVEPGDFMAFCPPWDGGEYDT
jgi:hypothetical protein